MLAWLARVVVNLPAGSLNFTNANPGATVSYSSGLTIFEMVENAYMALQSKTATHFVRVQQLLSELQTIDGTL